MNTSLLTVYEIWRAIKTSIQVGDIDSAAEKMVNYLVDHDFDAKEIKLMFGKDAEVQEALVFFVEACDDHDLVSYDHLDNLVQDLYDADDDYYDDDDY